MKTSANGRHLIEEFEGLILQSYDDFNDRTVGPGGSTRGTLSIGYGHTNAAGPPHIYAGQRITKDEADQILSDDLSKVEADVTRLVSTNLNQNQFDALVSFEFNTGALGHSSALTYLNSNQFEQAWVILSQYTHAAGRPLPGLVMRRKKERDLFFTAPKFPLPPVKKQQSIFGVIYELLKKLLGQS